MRSPRTEAMGILGPDRGAAAPLIVHVVYNFEVGGLQNGIVNLINRMPSSQWRHAIVSLTDFEPGFSDPIERSDVEFIALRKRPGHLVGLYPKIAGLFRSLAPAVVHTRNLAALEAVAPAWAARVPVRIHGEHGWDIQDPVGRLRRYQLVRRVYRPFVTRYVALSRQIENYLQHRIGIAPARVGTILNGVDSRRFAPARGVRPLIPGCPFVEPDTLIVGTVGRTELVKDPLNLARAMARAVETAPALASRLRLVYVGDGPLQQELAAFVDRPLLRGRVWLAGQRSDVADILRGLDCFVLASRAEGTSNTILEAMATGLPVVATRVGGNPDLIESGMTGTLVAPGDPDTLAAAILDYASDRATARRHGKAARRDVETRFSVDRMVADYVALYLQAMRDAGVNVARDRVATQFR